MKAAALLLLAASAWRFDITDARGKKPAGVAIEASAPDVDDWYQLKVVSKSKAEFVLVWPFDGRAKAPDGPGAIPAVVIEAGDQKAMTTPRILTYLAAAELLGARKAEAGKAQRLNSALMIASEDPFNKGVGLLYAGEAADAVDPLARALKERERQLTRVPSEIYATAMLYGRALFAAGKFDDAALADLKAMNQRPSDEAARKARADALVKAGKPEAAKGLIERGKPE